MKFQCLLVLLLFIFVSPVFARKGKHKKKHDIENIKLIEGYSQRTVPGMRGAQVISNTNIIIIWLNEHYPETVFWRGDGGWFPCKMQKAHKIQKENMRNVPRGIEYRTEVATGADIHNGDTLMLTPLVGGKFPIPSEIPDTASNDIFYKTNGSGWLKFHVDTIVRKHDLVMP